MLLAERNPDWGYDHIAGTMRYLGFDVCASTQQLKALNRQMDVLKYKKHFYEQLLEGKETDRCNPAVMANVEAGMTKKN